MINNRMDSMDIVKGFSMTMYANTIDLTKRVPLPTGRKLTIYTKINPLENKRFKTAVEGINNEDDLKLFLLEWKDPYHFNDTYTSFSLDI